MADKTFDAVIVGGGNKALLLALYLIKYGGMSVGIFERRHEIGGCLATEEISAPGFRGNTHANMILPWYYTPVWRDFPEFWDYGAQWDQHTCSDGFVFKDKDNCLAMYSLKHDPTQERSANEIARFSKKDSDTWRKLWKIAESDEYMRVLIDNLFLPAEDRITGQVMERQGMLLPQLMEAGLMPDTLTMKASGLRAAQEWFDSPELQSCILRMAVSGAIDVNEPSSGMMTLGMAFTIPTIGFNRGGTHQIAHAAHQILVQHGCQFFTNTPIANLYATGGSWHVGSNAGSTEAYNCYRIIAKDLGLGKPWEEPGKEEPDSLVEQLKIVKKRVQDSPRAKAQRAGAQRAEAQRAEAQRAEAR
jgi:phytoene dehydrogenase-like protein